MNKQQTTGYQAVAWHEPIIYEQGNSGRRGLIVPKVEKAVRKTAGNVLSTIPRKMRRRNLPKLPELSEPEVVRHYLRLSQQTFGVDTGINVGVGTCTMKYSPKMNESLVTSHKITDLHPLQDEKNVQGILEILYRLEEWLCEISGMDDFSLQPRGGAHAVFTNACMIKAYHKKNREPERDEIITTVLSHPCNGSSPAVAGFKIITLYPDSETGTPDIEALKAAVSKHTAGLMITDPYDTGVFDGNLEEYIKIIHEAGGLVAIDQANANCILGILRIGDAGVDLCHFNLHKTFSIPHGSTGPGSAPIGVKEELARFLPIPTVERYAEKYFLNCNRPDSIGKVSEFYGVIPNAVRAYAWIMSMGAEGLRETAEVAVINNNYLIKKLSKVRGVTLPWSKIHPLRMQEARFSLEKMKEETGIGIDDVNRRIVDFGIQRCFTSHEPWIVPEPFTPEPPETTPKEDLDRFVEIFSQISEEAYTDPQVFRNSPHKCALAKVDLSSVNDPKKWAMTWRAYLRKNQRREHARHS